MKSNDKLKSNCSPEPDGFLPIMFKRLKYCLTGPLALVFNQLLSVGCVPPEWLAAYIVPVHKKRVTGDITNYCPITLTCVTSKILFFWHI